VALRVLVQGSGFKVQGSGFRVQGSGFSVERFRVLVNSESVNAYARKETMNVEF
jgi:hypothetical protein